MTRRLIAAWIITFGVYAVSCGGSMSAPSSTTLHGEVSDPAGDATADSRIAVSPDLIHATADVTAGSLTFLVQFAAGTFDRRSTRVSILLDTDETGSTGIAQASGMGADYGIDMDAGTSVAAITKADPAGCAARQSCFNPVGMTPVIFVGDGMQATVPLSLLGGDDGRMGFALSCYVLVAPLTPVVTDFMPNSGSAPGRIQ